MFGAAIFVDTETVPAHQDRYEGGWLSKLWFGHAKYIRMENGVISRRQEITFHSADEFWNWAILRLHKRIPTWLFAHNLAFDLTALKTWEQVTNGTLSLSDHRKDKNGKPYRQPLFVVDDPPTIIEFLYQDSSKLVAVDTLNYWRTSLETLGRELGFPKGDTPAYCHKLEEWLPYCIRDVEIIEKAICELAGWLKDNDYGSFRFSAPSLAMSIYRHKFLDHPIELHGYREVSELERASYYGGRLECFYIGKSKGTHYEVDVAALYPFVMRDNLYPTKLLDCRLRGGGSKSEVKHLSLHHVAKVRIKTNKHVYPVRREEGLCHCLGEYTTTLAGPELVHAIQHGVVKEVYQWSLYQLDSIFSQFVKHFWAERRRYELEGQTTHATFCKLMMNSLYGKFGQQTPEYEFSHSLTAQQAFGTYYEWDEETGVTTQYRATGDRVDRRLDRAVDVASEVASPVISSYVTAYGREHMRMLREVAGEKHTYYIATDALYVDEIGYSNLSTKGHIVDRTPGKLSEKHRGDELRIAALHQLSLGGHVLTGSLKKSACPLPNGGHQELHFEGLKSILSQARELSNPPGSHPLASSDSESLQQPLDGVVIYPVVKNMTTEYRKGVKTKSGWVKPLTLSE